MEATPFIYQKAAQNLSIYFDKNRGATENIYIH